MRRDPFLQDLSRDHHAVLLLAQCVRRAPADAGAHGKAVRNLRSFGPTLLLHFQEEELILFPQLRPEEAEPLLEDHRAVRADLKELAVAGSLDADRLAAAGERLRGHVQAEERAFDRLQRDLGRRQVADLGAALLEFRRRHRPGAVGPGASDFCLLD
ncbi:MAG TPA: hemerythrin domain-containing protein [Candidatus Thermoplasmatota archaeon]|nr:hemerythrin domain-containing protein [Candidatus Thermoplasmatota archaeon]